jgi:uncharacterized protein YqjF (DUF2071 family)
MSFRSAILKEVGHRPWPMPGAPWMMTQTWHDLLFAHWPVDAAVLRQRVPRALALDLYDGMAWIGVIPFHMTNVRPRGVPSLPFVSAFAELNVRTYVTLGGKPGVYFFSLDAASSIAVLAARIVFQLPYFVARMRVARDANGIHYTSRRATRSPSPVFEARYGPRGPVSAPRAGSLEYFLTERYCLYTMFGADAVRRLEIHHPPWQLQNAEADISVNTMAEAAGIHLPSTAPLLHFSRRQDAVAWWPARL